MENTTPNQNGSKPNNNTTNNNTNNGGGTLQCGNEKGILPACAPLANPFVPFQQNNPERYEAPKGLVRGTLFPGLDLPFMGMVNNQEKEATPLEELQALSFAVVELGEYLDTHADDTEALQLFRSYAELYKKGVTEYQRQYGPLMMAQSGADGKNYNWLQDPWPWDAMTTGKE